MHMVTEWVSGTSQIFSRYVRYQLNYNSSFINTYCQCAKFSSFIIINLLQVYYLPIQTFYNQVTLPTMLTSMPLIRDVIIREGITILHGHGVRKTSIAS